MTLLFLEFILQNLGLDFEIRQLLPQALCLDPQLLSLLLANLDLLFHHDGSFDRAVVFIFKILKG